MTYFLEYLLENYIIPGQVEAWICITDLTGVGLTSLPYGKLKALFSFMQNNYRARLYRGYTINAPWAFKMVWATIKGFLEETTVMKIKISSWSGDESMKEHINLSQIEKKYGGNSENITIFWPPHASNQNILLDNEDPSKVLISLEEYHQKLSSGSLAGYKLMSKLD